MDELEMQDERDKQEFVRVLLEQEVIPDGAAVGVAKRFADQGYFGLTKRQKYVLETHVLEAFRVKECSVCPEDIPWADQAEALDSGTCSQCAYALDKISRND